MHCIQFLTSSHASSLILSQLSSLVTILSVSSFSWYPLIPWWALTHVLIFSGRALLGAHISFSILEMPTSSIIFCGEYVSSFCNASTLAFHGSSFASYAGILLTYSKHMFLHIIFLNQYSFAHLESNSESRFLSLSKCSLGKSTRDRWIAVCAILRVQVVSPLDRVLKSRTHRTNFRSLYESYLGFDPTR